MADTVSRLMLPGDFWSCSMDLEISKFCVLSVLAYWDGPPAAIAPW
jgi:hypothetical protein